MKLSRLAIAAVAVTTAAAVAIPAASRISAEPVDAAVDTLVDVSAPDDPTDLTGPSKPVDTPSTETVSDVLEDVADVDNGAVVAEDLMVTPGDLRSVPLTTDEPAEGEREANMPVKTLAVPGTVRELTVAPKSYTGGDQSWFRSASTYGFTPLAVYSPSMGRDIPIAFRKSPVPNAPTVYLLNGAGGSEQNTDWIAQAGSTVYEVFQDENVNVVIPMEGAFSYYVNWLSEPEQNSYYHGKQMWSTFLGEELPKAIEPYAQANDKRAVVGFSMSATSALLLAQHYEGQYDAVGSFSGCAATSTALPWWFTQLTVNRGSSAITPEHLWGPMGSEYNRYNDALVNAERLRGTAIYVSTGTGLAGETDMPGYLEAKDVNSGTASANAATLQVEGGAIEAAMNACTHDLRAKLDRASIPAHWELRPTGTHSWPSWRDDLKKSWDTTIKPALGLSA
ncbi:alpha/beta hydrolase [Corynebacterium qintianiae]|nr:alpha/beta hydrolase family protein [Corynebacterium qintianiae]